MTYQVDASNATNPKLTRTQGGTTDVIAEQIIGFKVGATILNSATYANTDYYQFDTSTYNSNFSLVRSVQLSLIGRTAPNSVGGTNFTNNFDGGNYQIQSISLTVNPRNFEHERLSGKTMKMQTQPKFSRVLKAKKQSERGAALVIALLLLLLLTGMTVAMVLSTSSDMLINGYYRNFRGSFYAADSGLTIARQAMVNNILAAVPGSFSTSTQPIPGGTEATVVTTINTLYGASYQKLNQGNATDSWPEQYKLDTTKTTLALASCQVVGGGGTCAAPTGSVTGYQYVYNYTLTAFGQSRGTEAAVVDDSGSFTFVATLAASGGTSTSFAGWGMFIDQYGVCTNDLVAGTITGPVFTNGSWNFGTGNYIFTDSVGSAGGTAGFDFGGTTGCQPRQPLLLPSRLA